MTRDVGALSLAGEAIDALDTMDSKESSHTASSLPLMIQGDRTILLDVHSPLAKAARDALLPFAQLVSSPEHIHTYSLTPLSLWNALSAGYDTDDIIEALTKYSRYSIAQSVLVWIKETGARYGKLRLVSPPAAATEDAKASVLYLVAKDELVYRELCANKGLLKYLLPKDYPIEGIASKEELPLSSIEAKLSFSLRLTDRGIVKQSLLELGYPVKDCVPLVSGEPLDIQLLKVTRAGRPLVLRDYQIEAAQSVIGNRAPGTGYGTIVLPCGAGKTIVGLAMMSMLKTNTLIVTTNISSVHQWISELLDKTNLTSKDIAEYSGKCKDIRPVTVATYQILSWRATKSAQYLHFELFYSRHWGLIIYDEVHTLPAPVFQVVAQIQAVRRVGLTATLVREDGHEGQVFSLVGPKRYDVPWKELEHSGWIAHALCIEVRIDLPYSLQLECATSTPKVAYRIAAENPLKPYVVQKLIEDNYGESILVIGQYIKQLEELSSRLSCPIITGRVPSAARDKIYEDFRRGRIKVLVVSKVANFAIDLPDASVAIQVSGSFGSRQEEAQRLGRIMRPKERTARFYTIVTRNTVEEDFSANRQKFLAEQGYEYRIDIPDCSQWQESVNLKGKLGG